MPPSAKSPATTLYTESGQKLTFACAYDWPGWCRSSKGGEEAALEALASYASRYAPVARRAKLPFDAGPVGNFRVLERIKGSANTDFGVPHEIARLDTTPLSAADGKRLAALVDAAWAMFDEVAAKAPAELRKGPRGGGRDRDKMIDHVLGADEIYGRKLGLLLKAPSRDDRAAIRAFRTAVIEVLRKPSKGTPLVEKG